ncbi:OTU-domain-containing protein [Coniophora puteana RWD-64-598 SS2]|uniref:OTU-domain-containing protein n=1 Tax=Coniophora puteana (strain RWD-64-598) TaxID=741705 RepID=A0A5M3N2I1_CONPW|nr:OTU-domain-containing protein [Coniophora puteana RWD-64-598 SS2]EIW85224.1 OTU-domain-containing protein [Coniophora puteana RWD-64-598 SS2]
MAGSKRNKIKKAFSPKSAAEQAPVSDANDEELMDDLFAQLDSREQTSAVKGESATIIHDIQAKQVAEQSTSPPPRKQDPKNRHQARQARRAAAFAESYPESDPNVAARLEREAKQEEEMIKSTCDQLNLHIYDINPDGHCMFSAVADQLALLQLIPESQANYASVRDVAARYMFAHPDNFIPFLPSSVGEDGAGSTDDTGLMTPAQFERYCASIRDTAVWGGEPEILALSRAYNIPIHVVQGGTPPVVVHTPTGESQEPDATAKAVRISYHRRMYGLGEHYNSLRPRSSLTAVTDKISSILR